MKEKIRIAVFMVFIVSAVYFCLKYPSDIGAAVSLAADRCINVIVPSMFIFMCITSAAVSSGIHNMISLPFYPMAKYIFRMHINEFGIFILSMFSGYPAGIKILTERFRRNEISSSAFNRLSCFCFAGGPAFISGTVSGILYPGTSAGMLCFISVTTGNIAAAFLSRFISPPVRKKDMHIKTDISPECLINATLSSAKAIFNMCVMITAFGGIYRAIEISGLIDYISSFVAGIAGTDTELVQALISSFFEISNIVNLPPGRIDMLPIVSALLSFGGVCVLIQVTALSENLLNIRKFLTVRAFAAFVSALSCKLASRFFDLGISDVFAVSPEVSRDPLSSVMLLIMTIMLLSLSNDYRQHHTNTA